MTLSKSQSKTLATLEKLITDVATDISEFLDQKADVAKSGADPVREDALIQYASNQLMRLEKAKSDILSGQSRFD